MMWERLGPIGKTIVEALVVGAAAFCFYWFILGPQVKTYLQVRGELAQQRVELGKSQAAASSSADEMLRLAKARERHAEEGQLFATEMRYGVNVIALGLKAAAQGVDIVGIEPGPIKENPHSLELPLKITTVGDYRKQLLFCRDIETLSNLAEVRYLSYQSGNAGGTSKTGTAAAATGNGTVNGVLGVVIYSAKTPEGRLALSETSQWLQGRYNIFRPVGSVAPIPQMAEHIAGVQASGAAAPASSSVSVSSSSSTGPGQTTGPDGSTGSDGTAASGSPPPASGDAGTEVISGPEPDYHLNK